MSRRGLTAVAAATAIATPLALWAVLASTHPAGPKYALASFGLLIALTFIGSGVAARARRPDNRTGLLMIGVGFAWYFSALSQANSPAIFTFGSIVGALSFGFLIHLVVAFPSGRLETKGARVIALSGYALVLAVNIASVLFSDLRDSCGTNCPRNVLLAYHDESLARALQAVFAVLALFLAAAIVALLARRWRRASVAMRRALLPVFLAGAATLGASAVELAASSAHRGQGVTDWALLTVFVSVPLAFLLGLLRSRLAGVAVGRLLVSHDATADPRETAANLRAALGDPDLQLGYWYAGGAGYVDADGAPLELHAAEGSHLTELTDESGAPLAGVLHDVALLDEPDLLSGVLAAARLGLQRDKLQAELRARLADLHRERDFFSTVANVIPALLVGVEPNGRVHAKGGNRAFATSTGYPDPDAVGQPLWDLVHCEDLRLGIAESVATDATSTERESVWRTRGGDELTVLWTCTPLPYGDDEEPIHAVVALDISARKQAEVQLKQSRARIVAAGAAERRRLERNLHDGAQQRLVSVSLNLRLAQRKLKSEPATSERMLGEAAAELTLALEELRELARGLHPAVLTERGLEVAIRGLAQRAPLAVELDVELADRLPEEIEAALFYVVAESLTNVAKYAQAQTARVRVAVAGGWVTAAISDDGVGGAAAGTGTGLRGLADRVEALDGKLSVDSAPRNGTTVTAVLPLST